MAHHLHGRIALIGGAVLLAACSRHEPAAPAIAATTPPAAPKPVAAPAKPAENANTKASPSPRPEKPADDEAFAQLGEKIFMDTCATCHMADGSGVPYLQPKIKGSALISNPDSQYLLTLILRGSAVLGKAAETYENDMAPQDHLTDTELAAVATYVRHRFAATPISRPVTPAEAAEARKRPGFPP
jgi:mono/diheme cytochrome c family protein